MNSPGEKQAISFVLAMACTFLPVASEASPLAITDLLKSNPAQGEYEITGYIAKRHSCPVCSQESMCKPCMRNNVLLSSKKEILESYPPDGEYVVVFTDAPMKLKLQAFYKLKVRVLKSHTTGYQVHDLELRDALEQADRFDSPNTAMHP
jgi:hypothetical protein